MYLLLLVAVSLWIIIVPFIILSKIGASEERLAKELGERISEAEKRLKRQLTEMHTDTARAAESVHSQPEVTQPLEKAPVSMVCKKPLDSVVIPIPAAPIIPPLESNVYAPLETNSEAQRTPPRFGEPIATFEPQEPGITELTIQKSRSWLLAEGNIWVCAGVLLFLVGFGLLFNYAIQRGLLSLEVRLAAAAITGIAMTGFGFQIRERRRAYGLILQGGGMGILYLVVLAASMYNLLSTGQPILPPAFAVVAMLTLSVFTVLLALLQNYQPLAIFAILGGFAAPILIDGGFRDHVTLFLIYVLLSLEILALSTKRDWRLLNRMGFVLTLAAGTAWGVQYWEPELFNSVGPFLVIFLVIYTLAAVTSGGDKARSPDLFLAVSAPFAFFFLQAQVVGHFMYGMALTCLGLGLWHLLLAVWLRRRESIKDSSQEERFALPRLYMFLCILFSNLVIPYTFDNTVSSAIWAVEGAFLIAAAYRTGSYKAMLGGIALHMGAMWLYSHELAGLDLNVEGLLSPIFVSAVLFALSLLCSGFCAVRFNPATKGPLHDKWEEALEKFWSANNLWALTALSWTFTVLGALWWWIAIYDQVPRFGLTWISIFSVSCLTALLGSWLSVRFDWKAARFLLVWPVASAFVETITRIMGFTTHPQALFSIGDIQLDAFIYLVFVGGALYILRGAKMALPSFALFFALWPGLYLTEAAIFQLGSRLGDDWVLLLSVSPVLGLLLFLRREREKIGTEEAAVSRTPIACATGASLMFIGWRFFDSFSMAGSAVHGIFIPILNPLELWQVAVLFSFALWAQIFALEEYSFKQWPKPWLWAFAALFFVWFNQVAVRLSWHYWPLGLPYNFWDIFHTPHCQAVIAIFWGILGLSAILYGQKTRSRELWYMGAGLLAADILKLFLVDLSGAETLVRVVAFLVLGGLFLLIGWIAPLPPKEEDN